MPRVSEYAVPATVPEVAVPDADISSAQWLGTERIVRTMPNTPALVGKGMSALYARAGVSNAQRQSVEAIMATTGDFLWVESEKQLDAVTALSGSAALQYARVNAANNALEMATLATHASTSLVYDAGTNTWQRAALTGAVTASQNGNATTLGAGVASTSIVNNAGSLERAALTGDVTASADSNTTTIANDAVTYAKMQNVSATAKVPPAATSSPRSPTCPPDSA